MPHTTDAPIFSEFGHDEDFAELIEMFVDALPERMQNLRLAVVRQEVSEARRLAHQLKGAFGSYGFHPLTDVLQQLESDLHDNSSRAQVQNSLDAVLEKVARIQKGSPQV